MYDACRTGLRLFTACIMLVGLMTGCSDKEGISGSIQATPTTGVEAYFPLTESYTTSYIVTNSDGTTESVRYEAGAPVDFQLGTAVPWYGSSSDGNHTAYFRTSNTALYYYSSPTASSEKLLELPLTTGKSWYRDAEYLDDTTSIITGFDDGLFDDFWPDGNDEPFLITFPITGATAMTVSGKAPIELNTGLHFSEAVEVSSDNHGTGATNHYWFVCGIGLVKWAKGVTGGNIDLANETGELVEYGFRAR